MNVCILINGGKKDNGQRLLQVTWSYCEKHDHFFNDRSTKDVELHYYCYIFNTHMKPFLF